MSTPGQKKAKPKPPATPTRYEISILIEKKDAAGATIPGATAWQPQAEIASKGGARSALRTWAEAADDYAGQQLRAVPLSNITEQAFDVAIERKLTPKAP